MSEIAPAGSARRDELAGGRGFACLTVDAVLEHVQGRTPTDAGQAVQAHVDECARCRLLLVEAARGMDADVGDRRSAGRTTRAPMRTLRDGERLLDRYEILRFVSRGGMGEVYEARDTLLDERVALKTLTCTLLDDARASERLIAEVQLARKIAHENVCRMFEFGIHRRDGSAGEEAIPFLTMELLAGETLGKRISRKGRLGEREALNVLRQMVAGLDAVHAAGIVHRDFKSDNVMVLNAASSGSGERRARRVVVTDFGLARQLEGLRLRGWTTGPFIVGTIDYMSPEQLDGKPPTPAFDVYALGVVIYEMLTGVRPLAALNVHPGALRLDRIAAPRPSTIVPALDVGWDRLIGRCLDPDPARRFANVYDVLMAAEAIVLRRRRTRWVRRRLGPVAVGLLIGAFAALAFVATLTR